MKKRTRRPTRHELNIEIRILTAERNLAVWERNRMAKTVDELLALVAGTSQRAVEIVQDQYRRDGDAFDAPGSSDTDDSWLRI